MMKTRANLTHKPVVITRDVHNPMGHRLVPSGSVGRVEWDEGGDEVVVEFQFEVSNHGYSLDNARQMWISRAYLRIMKDEN